MACVTGSTPTRGPGADFCKASRDRLLLKGELDVFAKRLRFQLAASDPMSAIIGAVGRLTDAGMGVDDAMDTVLRIMREADCPTD